METGSYLTRSKGVRRTGGRNASPLEWPSPESNTNLSTTKGSNQGDSDSEFTLFTSSTNASTSSATSSINRYSNGKEARTQRKKTMDKSNSKKRWIFRLSKRMLQYPSMSLPDNGSATTRHPSPVKASDESPVRKPVLKITRSGSLRSLKIVRNKSKSSSESKGKRPTAEDLPSNRGTFSSILKDSKFPEQVKIDLSEEILPVAKICPYQHCSLHGHHHHHEPPVKRFSFLKRRSLKDQKVVNPKTPATVDKPSSKKTEVKVTKKGIKSKKHERADKEDVDFSIEFYAKTRSDRVLKSSSGRDAADLANIMFDVNGNNQKKAQNLHMDDKDGKNQNPDGFADVGAEKPDSTNSNQMSMWRLIKPHMISDLVAESGCELDQKANKEKQSCNVEEAMNQENENRKMFVIKIVREAIQKVLPEVPDHQLITSEVISEQDSSESGYLSGTEKGNPDGWSPKKKVILLRRFITELEKVKEFDPNKRKLLPLVPESEAETVSLRPQIVGEKKSSDDWMLDYALQQVVSELSPTQKRKVALLVKAFESVAPKLNDSEEFSLTDRKNGDYKKIDEKGVDAFDQKEEYIKMWHMVYQHVVADITSKVGSELLHDDEQEQEVDDENLSNDFSPRSSDVMLIRQSVNDILLPEVQEDASLGRKDVDGDELQNQQMIPKNWNKLRTLRRSIKELESFRKPNLETQVDLRRQMSREKTKAEQWMIDYAVQHIVTKLTPARKKRVSMLVEAFEAVIPLPDS